MKRLNAEKLSTNLVGCEFAREIFVLEETESTNDLAAQFGRDGRPHGAVVFAETQTAGRGRLGRKWESASGAGLWFSILLRPEIPDWTRLTTFAAVAIAEAIESVIDARALVKWPNDIYLGEKKVVGILIESSAGADGFAVLGVGVNVNQTEFPETISDRAGSLRQIAGHELEREAVAIAILRSLEALYPKLAGDFHELVAAAEARSYLRGRWLEADCAGVRVSGVAEGLDENGALILRKSEGDLLTLRSGEVTISRL